MKNLYVGNIDASTTDVDLKTAFSTYGPVAAVTIITDKATGFPRGFAFLEMSHDKGSQDAILV